MINELMKDCFTARPAITCSKLPIETLEQGINMFKVNKKTPERCQWRHSGVFIVNFEHT